MPVFPALRRLKQEGSCDFEGSLEFIVQGQPGLHSETLCYKSNILYTLFWCWGLNSGLCACEAGGRTTELNPRPTLFQFCWDFLGAQVGFLAYLPLVLEATLTCVAVLAAVGLLRFGHGCFLSLALVFLLYTAPKLCTTGTVGFFVVLPPLSKQPQELCRKTLL